MNTFLTKFMAFVGGKRGLSVIASALTTILLTKGVISPETAETAGQIAGALGIFGIGHSIGKNSVGAPPAPAP